MAAAPFIASFTPFLDETLRRLRGPDPPGPQLSRRFEDAAPAPAIGTAIFGIRQPVVEPLHATRSTGDVVIELAQALGGGVGEAFPWKDFRLAVLRRASGLQAADRGSITAADAKQFIAALLRAGSGRTRPLPSRAGARSSPRPRVASSSSRSGCWSALEAAAGAAQERRAAARGLGHAGDPELACLPHHRELALAGSAESYPLVLEPFKPGTYAQGSGANLPLLQELAIEPGAAPWVASASLEPRTAESLGIRAGDRIAIESPVGRIELPVTIWPGVRPGCVRVPQGSGHTAFGRFAKGRGANVMEILAAGIDPLGGIPPAARHARAGDEDRVVSDTAAYSRRSFTARLALFASSLVACLALPARLVSRAAAAGGAGCRSEARRPALGHGDRSRPLHRLRRLRRRLPHREQRAADRPRARAARRAASTGWTLLEQPAQAERPGGPSCCRCPACTATTRRA